MSTLRRGGAVALLGVVAWLGAGAAGGAAWAQTPSQLPCAPPITVCPTTTPPGSPSPTPTPTQPSARPTPSPTPQPSPEPTTDPPVVAPPPVIATFGPTPASMSAAPDPVVASSSPPAPSPSTSGADLRLASGRVPLAAGFALVVLGVLVAPLAVTFLASRLPPVAAAADVAARPAPSGGMLMHPSSRWRLWFGAGSLGLAALVAVIGWYKISGERLLNFQVPLLASAGLAVVLLSVLGGSMLVADQMRGDDRRLDELEEAVRALAAALAPGIELPARRAGGLVVTEPNLADEPDAEAQPSA